MKEVTLSELIGIKAYEVAYNKVLCFKVVWKSIFVDKGVTEYWEFRYPRTYRHGKISYNNISNIHYKDFKVMEHSNGANLIDISIPYQDDELRSYFLYDDLEEMERDMLLEDMTWRN